MTDKLTIEEELDLFATTYHNMKLLEIDQTVIDQLVESFAEQFEIVDEDEDETKENEKPYLVYLKGTNTRWGAGDNYRFATREAAINEIIYTYQYSLRSLQQSRDSFAPNYWANTYEIRKETTKK